MFADGVAVRQVGERPFALARATVAGVIRVTRGQICEAMRRVFEDTRGIVEPAGALAVAALDDYAAEYGRGAGAVVSVLSGGNVDFEVLGQVARQAAATPADALSAAGS
jgi:threonine dehydratase